MYLQVDYLPTLAMSPLAIQVGLLLLIISVKFTENEIRKYLTVPVSVEVKMSFEEPGRRWAHSPSPSKAPGISYQGAMKSFMRMLKTSGGL